MPLPWKPKPIQTPKFTLTTLLSNKSLYKECESCPLYIKSPRVPDEIPPEGADIILIGESPGFYEDDAPFTGPAGKLLRAILRELGITSFALTNRCHCRSYDSEGKDCPPPKAAIQCCSSQLARAITQSKAKIIVALGNTATSLMPGWEKAKISQIHGTITTHPTFRKPFMPILHPAAPLHSGSYLQLSSIRSDLATIKCMLKGLPKSKVQLVNHMIVETIDIPEKMERLIQEAPQVDYITYDIETPGGRPEGLDYTHPDIEIMCYAVAFSYLGACVVPVHHPELGRTQAERRWWLQKTAELLNAAKKIVCHNAKFDLNYTRAVFRKYGIKWDYLDKDIDDTMAMHYAHHHPSRHGLKDIGMSLGQPDWSAKNKEFLDALKAETKIIEVKTKTGKVKEKKVKVHKEVSWYDLPLDQLCYYNGIDAAMTALVRDQLMARADISLTSAYSQHFYNEILRDAVKEFANAESSGIFISEEGYNKARDFFVRLLARRSLELAQLPLVMDYLVRDTASLGTFQSLPERYLKGNLLPKSGPKELEQVFNPNSTKQLKTLLFDRGGLSHMSYLTKKGAESGKRTLSTDATVLGKMKFSFVGEAAKVPGIWLDGAAKKAKLKQSMNVAYGLMEESSGDLPSGERREALAAATGYATFRYRMVAKLYSGYIKPIPRRMSSDGLYHPELKLTRTATGRLASEFHTMPKDARLRGMLATRFGPNAKRPEWKCSEMGALIGSDFSQVEVRVLAILGDRHSQYSGNGPGKLAEVYHKDMDMHRVVASIMLGVPEKDVSDSERNLCKNYHFGMIYLESAESLADAVWTPAMGSMEVLVIDIQNRMNNYFAAFPEVKLHIRRVQKDFKLYKVIHAFPDRQEELKSEYNTALNYTIVTPTERVLRAPFDISKWDQKVIPVNWPIQECAGTLTTIAAIKIAKRLRKDGCRAVMLGTIHDAIYIDTPPEEKQHVVNMVYDYMEDVSDFPWFSVPMKAEVTAGEDWGTGYIVDRELKKGKLKTYTERLNPSGFIVELD